MATLIDNNDTRLFTEVYENSGKDTVMLLHGGPGVPEDLGPVAHFLARHFQVIYFHQRGTAKSPCLSEDYSIESYLSDLDRIAAYFDLQQFHLFGHSWGGLYAQLYADHRKNRVQSLFLCSPAPGTARQWAEMALEVRRFNKRKSTLREWLALNTNALLGLLGSNKAYQRFYRQFGINCNKGYQAPGPSPLLLELVRARPVNRTNKAVLTYPGLRGLPAPRFKITVTFGDDDIYGDSPRHIRQRYPTADFVTIPHSSHNPWLHQEKAFFEVLAAHFGLDSQRHT